MSALKLVDVTPKTVHVRDEVMIQGRWYTVKRVKRIAENGKLLIFSDGDFTCVMRRGTKLPGRRVNAR